jgi:hypothetical protein
VEDRLATLKNVIKEPELDKWSLYLGGLFPLPYHHFWFPLLVILTKTYLKTGTWGYNTEKERAEAAGIPMIQVIELSTFSNKLK